VSAKHHGKPHLVEALFSNTDHGVVKLGTIETIRIEAIELQKREGRAHRRALVAIEEWLILGDVKCIRRGDIGQVALSVEIGGFGLHEGGVQQTGFTQAVQAAVLFK